MYEHFSPINLPYGSCLLKSGPKHRQGVPGPAVFGDGVNYTECVPRVVKTPQEIGPQNTKSVNIADTYFLNNKKQRTPKAILDNYLSPDGYTTQIPTYEMFTSPNLQSTRPPEIKKNSYIQLAGESLHAKPDLLISVFFSDDNINHLRNIVVKKVKEITQDSGINGTEGVTIKTPNMDDFFYYMVNMYQNYKIYNGSICFVNLKSESSIQAEISKLNSNILQEYVSKMVSQINMYIYYYLDASQLPQQLSLPRSVSMKGSKTLEYNTGFKSGNSIGIASYNEVGNIF